MFFRGQSIGAGRLGRDSGLSMLVMAPFGVVVIGVVRHEFSRAVSQVVFLFPACRIGRKLVVGVSKTVASGAFLSPRGRASLSFLRCCVFRPLLACPGLPGCVMNGGTRSTHQRRVALS